MTASFQQIHRFLLLGVLASSPGFAQETPPVAPAENSATEEAPAQAPTDNQAPEVQEPDPEVLRQAAETRNRYQQVVEQLEETTSQNIYNVELLEAYLNLAGSLTTLAEYDEAAVVYDKALQNVRISDGLNSLQQIPILEQAMRNNEIRGNWEDVDAMAHLMFHIARRNYPVGHDERIRALARLGDWRLRAFNQGLVKGFDASSAYTADLFTDEIERMEDMEDYEGKGYHMAALYLGEAKAKLSYAAEILKRPLSDYRTGTNSATTRQERCYIVRLPNGSFQQVCETVEVPNMDYYIDPSSRKNMDIGRQLMDVRRDLTDVFEMLQTAGDDLERRDALLLQMQDITNNYNTFVTDHSL